jgi:spore coat polysaccharide biosynthesis protein SpsF
MRNAIFIPVRLSSSRLPRKGLLDLAGRPALEHLIEGMKLAKRLDVIVLCTTNESIDDPLVDVANRSHVEIFRGSRDDLLDRYRGAALRYGLDFIVNVDGDDILTDYEHVDGVAAEIASSDADFVRCEGLPFGANPLGFRVGALQRVCELKTTSDTATGWGRYFTDTGLFNCRVLQITDPELNHPEIRLTMDYTEDYRLLCALFGELYRDGKQVRLRDVIRLLQCRPELLSINSGLEERYWNHFNTSPAPKVSASGSRAGPRAESKR